MKFQAVLLFLVVICTAKGYSQQPIAQSKENKLQLRQFFQARLQIDSARAAQVSQIQENYKSGVYLVVADTSLSEAVRRARINAIMEVKNQKLRQILSQAQQEKIIPSSERVVNSSIK